MVRRYVLGEARGPRRFSDKNHRETRAGANANGYRKPQGARACPLNEKSTQCRLSEC